MSCCNRAARKPPLLTPEDIRLLTQVGFIAAGQADVIRAERIFGALARLRPARAFAPVGRAMALLNAGRAPEAVQALQQARPGMQAGEDADTLAAFLALALQLDGRSSESRRTLHFLLETAAPGADNDGLRLARRMLGEPSSPSTALAQP